MPNTFVLVLTTAMAFGEPERGASSIELRGGVEWLTAARWLEPTRTPLNPRNLSLGIPQLEALTELRPNLKLEHGHALAAVLRPRLLASIDWVRAGEAWRKAEGAASFSWTEVYLSWRLSERVAMTYGIQNFQWGPGELISPTNRLFLQSSLIRDPLFLVRGREMLRVNVSANQSWTALLLVELRDNGEPPLVVGETFRPRGQLKVEYASVDDASYAGVTAGVDELGRGWVGEYGQLTFAEAFFLYAEANHQSWTNAYFPSATPLGPTMAQTRPDPDHVAFTHVLVGARYNFEGGQDVRLELVHNDAGYSSRNFREAYAAGRRDPSLLPVVSAPGYELIGKDIAYVSLRLPELPPAKKVLVELRYAHSLTDSSGAAFVNANVDVLDALVLFASCYGAHGPRHGEFARFVRGAAILGVAQTW